MTVEINRIMCNIFYLIYYTSWYDRSVGSSQFVREQAAKSNIQTYYSHFLSEVRLLSVMLVCVCMPFLGKEDLKHKNKPVGMCHV